MDDMLDSAEVAHLLRITPDHLREDDGAMLA